MKNYKGFPHILLLVFCLFCLLPQVKSAGTITGTSPALLDFKGYTNEVIYLDLLSDNFTYSDNATFQGLPSFITYDRVGATRYKFTLGSRSQNTVTSDFNVSIFANFTFQKIISVRVKAELLPGAIVSSVTKIAMNTSPGLFDNASSASGGEGNYKYQWQKSIDGAVSWVNITGATGVTYSCPILTGNTCFQRRVISSSTTYSNVICIFVALTGGVIDCGSLFTSPNTSPGTFYCSSEAQGGYGNYIYQWQSSSNGGSWIDIPGATQPTYDCPVLSYNTVFQRRVTSGSLTSYSNELPILLINTSNSENYIVSITPQIAAPTESALSALSVANLTPTIQYLDGLGQPKQTISIGASPSGKDIVQPIIYDELGREQYKLLPYVCSSNTNLGAFRINPVKPDDPSEQKSFYTNATNESQGLVYDAYPYAKTIFEPSPLSRVLQQGAPGADWQPMNNGHVQEADYQSNGSNEVLLFTITGNTLSPIIGNYAINQLYVTQRTDEDKHISKEYKDQEGQVVLKRNVDGNTNLDTYYVYDDFGLLRFVLPPEAIDKINKVRSATPPASGAVTNITASITKNVYENTSYVISTGSTLTLGNGFYFKATPSESFSVTNSGQLSQSDQYNLAYQYQYDERKRMIVKKIPGADEVFMVYDKRDRLVLTQDGKMRAENNKQWNFIKYDPLNRPVLTGVYIHPQYQTQEPIREQMQAFVNSTIYPNSPSARAFCVARDNSVAITGYTDASFPMINDGAVTYLMATYYDTYGFPGCAARLTNDPIIPTGTTNFTRLSGIVTGSKEMVLKTKEIVLNTPTYLTTTNYYDDHYRVIQSKRDLYDGNVESSSSELVSNKYDFVGKVTQTRQVQTFSGTATTTIDKGFLYDHAGRLTHTDMMVTSVANGVTTSSGLVTTSEATYNEIGQLIDKKLHKGAGGIFTQSVDFAYNIRGWLTGINDPALLKGSDDTWDDLFSERLCYNIAGETSGTPLYNGNISSQVWRSSLRTKGYNYYYDALNRINSADYKELIRGWVDETKFEEKGITYDFNGNIQTLQRTGYYGPTTAYLIADYKYHYNGNQLKDLNGGATYNYDANGNMTVDGRTGNDFTYNLLNLPQKVSKGSDNINYTYSATGQKLLKNYNGTSNQYYAGNMVYSNAKALDYIIFEEGVIRTTSTGYSFEYNLKDHLGNTRAVFRPIVGEAPELAQVTDYYPFGQQFNVPSATSSTKNKYLYNGKELQDDKLAGNSLDMLDYGARFYDAEIGRWGCIDQLAENYYDHNPYCYVGNNPISRFDPDGRKWSTDKDKEKAKKLQELSKQQQEKLKNANSILDKKIDNAKEKDKKRKMARLEKKKENNKSQISELRKGVDEIQALGDNTDYTFTYSEVSRDKNQVTLLQDGENPLLSIEFSTDGLALHESRHAYQYITGGKSSGKMLFNQDNKLSYLGQNATVWYETKAYQLQYSFSNSSLPINASAFYGIDAAWLKRIPDNPYNIR